MMTQKLTTVATDTLTILRDSELFMRVMTNASNKRIGLFVAPPSVNSDAHWLDVAEMDELIRVLIAMRDMMRIRIGLG